jgi:hypothetical protein
LPLSAEIRDATERDDDAIDIHAKPVPSVAVASLAEMMADAPESESSGDIDAQTVADIASSKEAAQ